MSHGNIEPTVLQQPCGKSLYSTQNPGINGSLAFGPSDKDWILVQLHAGGLDGDVPLRGS